MQRSYEIPLLTFNKQKLFKEDRKIYPRPPNVKSRVSPDFIQLDASFFSLEIW